ncbi:MAG: carboxypeptidase regulatory-like domain-containing protein [Terriglobales bacterium]
MKSTTIVIFRQTLIAMLLAFVGCVAVPARAQVGQATLTGTVEDMSGAVITGANVTLTDTTNQTQKTAVSDSHGFFAFSNLPAATYDVKFDKQGFAELRRNIVLHIADHVEIPNIRMAVSGVKESMTVTAEGASVTPDSTGEISYTLTSKQVQNLDIEGRNAIELLGLVPGAADSGNFNTDTYSGQTAGFTQNASAYSVNGNRFDLTQIVSDGATVTDINTAGSAAVTPNVEMIQEVKVVTTAFSSENPSGPIVMETETKSGGKDFHGEVYGTVRNHALNDTDWRVKSLGLPKPDDAYYYMGANIGGPVLIPGTGFNESRNKLFFFAAYEKALQYVQDPTLDIREAVTPTSAMRTGDFSDASYLANFNNTAYYASTTPCDNPGNNTSLCTSPTSGIINPGSIDPNGQVLINALPLPNADPTKTGGYNLVTSVVTFQPRDQENLKLDYNVSNANRLSARYNHEHESVPFPFGYYDNYTQNAFPGDQINRNSSNSIVGNLATSFTPTLINQLTFAYTRLNFLTYLEDPDALSRSALGYTAPDLYDDGSNIIPNVQPNYGNGSYASIYLVGGSYPTTNAPQQIYVVNENISKILGAHFFKAGVYFAHQQFGLLTQGPENSTIQTGDYGYSYNTGNVYADLLTGQIAGYAQSTSNFVANMREKRTDFFVQDQWRVVPRFSFNYGVRVNHIGSWYDTGGRIVVFDPSLYDPNGTYAESPGLVTHATTPNIPISGSRPQGFQVAPAGGFAWDFMGTGNTILRGGFSMNYYIDPGTNGFSGVQSPPNETFTTFYGLTTISNIPNINTYLPLGSYGIADINDHRLPVTYSYSFAVAQAFAHAIHVEMAYAGNASRNLTGYATTNAVPEGCIYEYDSYEGYGTGSYNDTLCRPYSLLGGLSTVTHNLSSYYNSAQVTASKQTGPVNFWATYTFAKGLAYNCENPFDERRCYGPTPFDRSQNLNISYLIKLPNVSSKYLGNNKVLNGILDDWQFTGIEQFASGTPLDFTAAASANGNTGDEYDGIHNRTINFYSTGSADLSNRNTVGTPDEQAVPTLVCDPTMGRKSGQYFNAACFQAPQEGTEQTGPSIGTYRIPYIHGPRYERDDIGLYKAFKINESRSIQFRAQAFNITNHPLNAFLPYDANLYLHYPDYGSLPTNAATAGFTESKLGARTIQLAMKFYF